MRGKSGPGPSGEESASLLWPGNTADVTTLLLVVEHLRTRFGVAGAASLSIVA
jgi:hypothetical protein